MVTPLTSEITSIGAQKFSFEAISQESPAGVDAMAQFNAYRTAHTYSSNGLEGNTLGRLVKSINCNYELAEALGELGPREVSQTFQYDLFGNVTQVIDVNRYVTKVANQVQVTKSEYDVGNRPIKKTICGDQACSVALAHIERTEYDHLGRVSRVLDKNENVLVQNHYNYIGQLTSQSLGGEIAATSSNTLLRESAYHLHGQLTDSKTAQIKDGTSLLHMSLGYEDGVIPRKDGNITQMELDYGGATTALNHIRYNYTYDDLNRLTDAEADSALGNEKLWYLNDGRIDSMGRADKTGKYSYDSKGRLDQVTGNLVPGRNMTLSANNNKVFDYDSNGNLIIDKSKSKGDQPLEIYYRSDNLPYMFVFKKEIPGSNPLRFDEYVFYMAYGGSGTRATKMTERNSTMESSKSYFGSGKEVRESVGGTPVVFNTLAGGGRVQYTTAKPDGSKEFYLTDHLGSTREVYDLSTGNITYTSQYYPYGKQFSEYKSQAENTTEKFTSKEYEEGIDFNYHGARYYDPELGIWTSADVARQFHGQYLYVGNGANPINSVDPDGNLVENVNYNELDLMVNLLSDQDADYYQETYWSSKEVFQWKDIYAGFQAVQNAHTWIGTARNDDSRDYEGYLHDCSGMMCKILGLPPGWGSSTSFRALDPLPYKTLIPGQLLTYGSPGPNHVGMYDPLGGGTNYLLSMTGKNSKGAFQYRDPKGPYSPWKNEKAIGIPVRP